MKPGWPRNLGALTGGGAVGGDQARGDGDVVRAGHALRHEQHLRPAAAGRVLEDCRAATIFEQTDQPPHAAGADGRVPEALARGDPAASHA